MNNRWNGDYRAVPDETMYFILTGDYIWNLP
jgi:hypothetical protein